MSDSRGFTLIELMIVVAIMGVLAAIATPKFGELIEKANEANTKGNLGVVRSAISLYYCDHEGQYPRFPAPGSQPAGYSMILEDALVHIPHPYLDKMPLSLACRRFHHPSGMVFHVWNISGNQDNEPVSGYGWFYDANPWDDLKPAGYKGTWGTFGVLCRHNDTKGVNWVMY